MTSPRLTHETLRILRAFQRVSLDAPRYELFGAEICLITGLASGTVYPTLRRLADHGWLTSRWEDVDPVVVGRPRRNLYRLTADGQRKARQALEKIT